MSNVLDDLNHFQAASASATMTYRGARGPGTPAARALRQMADSRMAILVRKDREEAAGGAA
jgi:hypothetical protein